MDTKRDRYNNFFQRGGFNPLLFQSAGSAVRKYLISPMSEEVLDPLRELRDEAELIFNDNTDFWRALSSIVAIAVSPEAETREALAVRLEEIQKRAAGALEQNAADIAKSWVAFKEEEYQRERILPLKQKIKELEERHKDLDDTFNGWLNETWALMYPGEDFFNTWEYPAQVYRHIRDYTESLKATIVRRDATVTDYRETNEKLRETIRVSERNETGALSFLPLLGYVEEKVQEALKRSYSREAGYNLNGTHYKAETGYLRETLKTIGQEIKKTILNTPLVPVSGISGGGFTLLCSECRKPVTVASLICGDCSPMKATEQAETIDYYESVLASIDLAVEAELKASESGGRYSELHSRSEQAAEVKRLRKQLQELGLRSRNAIRKDNESAPAQNCAMDDGVAKAKPRVEISGGFFGTAQNMEDLGDALIKTREEHLKREEERRTAKEPNGKYKNYNPDSLFSIKSELTPGDKLKVTINVRVDTSGLTRLRDGLLDLQKRLEEFAEMEINKLLNSTNE